MKVKTYIGIDNGVSGTIGIIPADGEPIFIKTPVQKVQDYTKAKKMISRVSVGELLELLEPYCDNCLLAMERPMVNPTRFASSVSAVRCHEAELTIIEALNIPYMFIDSKEWQKALLPKGIEGDEQKKFSLEIGNRLFPQFKDVKHPDRDGILIAEYIRRQNY